MSRLFILLLSAFALPLLGGTETGVQAVLSEIERSESLEQDLRVLCDEIGARPTGSPALERAVDWAVRRFEEIGVDRVAAERFEIPLLWQEGKTRIEAIEPERFSIQAAATAWSPATAKRGFEAELIDAGGGSQGRIRRLGKKAAGKILLVTLQKARTFFDLGVEQRNAIIAIREAAEVDAAAVLFASTRPNRVLYRHIHSVSGSLDPVPSAVLAREDALRLRRLLKSRGAVRLRVALPNKISGPTEAANVAAEILGSEKPNEVVILGAHLDSWDLGAGCLDNAVNVAAAIEALRAVKASGERPKRTLRVVLFSAEEQGLVGSRAYVDRHDAELDRIVAVLVHDMGVGKIEGYATGGRTDVLAGLEKALAPIESAYGPFDHSEEAFFGSDHFDFLIEGVPALVAKQATGDYVLPYHSEVDTFDKVEMRDVRRAAVVAAAAAWGVADLEERLGPRLDRVAIENLMRLTRLADQLEFLDLYDDWERGERGRTAPPATVDAQ